MKFVLNWETWQGSAGKENLQDIKDLLTVFSKWEGWTTVEVTEWVVSLTDVGTGWLVCTTDNSEELMSAIAKFSPWLTFTLTPVMDVQAGAATAGDAAEWISQQLG